MQTFLPHPDFEQSLRTLDTPRLGKQRVETLQIVRALTTPGSAWATHPATLMWQGFEEAVGRYGLTCCAVWTEAGRADTCAASITADLSAAGISTIRSQDELAAAGRLPPWLGDPALHLSHRSALVRKDPDRYLPMFPGTPDDLPYVWPVRSAASLAAEQRRAEAATRREERRLRRIALEVEQGRRRRSRAAKKAWVTRRANAAAESRDRP